MLCRRGWLTVIASVVEAEKQAEEAKKHGVDQVMLCIWWSELLRAVCQVKSNVAALRSQMNAQRGVVDGVLVEVASVLTAIDRNLEVHSAEAIHSVISVKAGLR